MKTIILILFFTLQANAVPHPKTKVPTNPIDIKIEMKRV